METILSVVNYPKKNINGICGNVKRRIVIMKIMTKIQRKNIKGRLMIRNKWKKKMNKKMRIKIKIKMKKIIMW